MKLAVDTNILVYAEGAGPDPRGDRARDTLSRLVGHEIVLPSQVLGELYNVLVRKVRWPEPEALSAVRGWAELFDVVMPERHVFDAAMDLAARARLQVWDAVIMATAAEAGCRLLLTEDLHDGFVFRGLTVVSPFAETPHPALLDLLEDSR